MGRKENLLFLPALAALASLANATEIISTSTFTTIFPTTAVVTSSSAIAGCTEAVGMQISCSNGYYNTYGAVWQETCAASYSGGTIISIGTGLSLRACASGCAVRPACSATVFEPGSLLCYMFSGDVTITPGGGYQAAARYAADASPCVSTWVVTETDLVTSTGEVVYTTTIPSPTPSITVTSSSIPAVSSIPVISSSIPVPLSSTPLVLSSIPLVLSSTPYSSSPISPTTSSGILSSIPLVHSSTPLIHSLTTTSRSTSSLVSSTPLTSPRVTSSVSTDCFSTSSTSSTTSTSTSSSSSSISSAPSGESPSNQATSMTQPAASPTAIVITAETPIGSSSLTQPAEQSSGSTPITTISTVTTTEIYTITSCAASVTNCPANQQTTYLTTETITYVTTICPEDDKTTATQVSGSTPTNSDTGVIPTSKLQHASTQTTSLPSAQGTEASIPHSHMTTSTVYATEIEVITACPPSVHNCPAGQESTHTISKTIPAYTTTYLVADIVTVTVTDSAQVSQFSKILVQPVAVPTGTVSLDQANLQTFQPADTYNDYTLSHSPSTNIHKVSLTSHASVQVATHATTMSTVSGGTTSAVTTSAPAFNGASKMGGLTSLPIVLAGMSALFFF